MSLQLKKMRSLVQTAEVHRRPTLPKSSNHSTGATGIRSPPYMPASASPHRGPSSAPVFGAVPSRRSLSPALMDNIDVEPSPKRTKLEQYENLALIDEPYHVAEDEQLMEETKQQDLQPHFVSTPSVHSTRCDVAFRRVPSPYDPSVAEPTGDAAYSSFPPALRSVLPTADGRIIAHLELGVTRSVGTLSASNRLRHPHNGAGGSFGGLEGVHSIAAKSIERTAQGDVAGATQYAASTSSVTAHNNSTNSRCRLVIRIPNTLASDFLPFCRCCMSANHCNSPSVEASLRRSECTRGALRVGHGAGRWCKTRG